MSAIGLLKEQFVYYWPRYDIIVVCHVYQHGYPLVEYDADLLDANKMKEEVGGFIVEELEEIGDM